jgi:hypothetical protein
LGEAYQKHLKKNVDSVTLGNIDLPDDARGGYQKWNHKIQINENDEDLKVHEVAHASNAIAQKKKIKQLKEQYPFLKKGVYPDSYYDNESEIYSRLMEVRKALNLDPNKKYSLKEIRDMIDKQTEVITVIPSKTEFDSRIVRGTGDGKHIKSEGTTKNLD